MFARCVAPVLVIATLVGVTIAAPPAHAAASVVPVRSAPYNLGGTVDGRYTDADGHTYDGRGSTVVDIDGAFDLTDPNLSSRVIAEYCFGQVGTAHGSLCSGGTTVSRQTQYAGHGLAEQPFVLQSGRGASAPSDGTTSACRDGLNFCHWFHGTMTAGLIAGNPSQRYAGGEIQPYSGAAPGAKLITMKVGSGTTGPAFEADNILNALLQTEKLVESPDTDELRANPIVAVNISNSGMYDTPKNWNPGPNCRADSVGARINAVTSRLVSRGVSTIFAAGNDALTGGSTPYTCGWSSLVAGATEIAQPGLPTSYSNVLDTGARTLYAPVGYGKWPADANTMLTFYPGGGASTTWGTSFAAPQIAGAIAVLAQKTGAPQNAADRFAIVDALHRSGTPLVGDRVPRIGGGRLIDIPATLNRLP
ncbi:S8 family serine peptidase [Frigoribacterium sp. PhB24]|uniref:S8 family serine peptidase n=1 Tax=Frigoribacterium sp. PhB24 TaxID=2485204 RepID=UPI000F49B456|nr:S8 family serine peptidase [Frigoribacterium sp. PhB24]ROS49480.1 subtilase family protein [Frigoribacterium sp. PhB24]